MIIYKIICFNYGRFLGYYFIIGNIFSRGSCGGVYYLVVR